MLPVVFADSAPYQSEESFHLQLTEKGQGHPIFTLSSDRVKDAATVGGRAAAGRHALVQRAKPGAEVLAVNPDVQIDGKPPAVVRACSSARRRPGDGADGRHDLALEPAAARLGQADTLYGRFWSQTIRWLAGRSLDDQRPLLTVSTDKLTAETGKQVTITVRRQPRPDNDLTQSEVSAEVSGPAGKPRPVALKALPTDPHLFTGTFFASGGGRHQVSANLTAAGKPLANQTTEFLVQGSDLELSDPATRPENLQTIAHRTGGAYSDIDQADRLGELIPPKAPHRAIAPQRVLELAVSVRLFPDRRHRGVDHAEKESVGLIIP